MIDIMNPPFNPNTHIDTRKNDVEIVELGALLHDIAMSSEFGPREEYNVYGMKIADELLTKLGYPQDSIIKQLFYIRE